MLNLPRGSTPDAADGAPPMSPRLSGNPTDYSDDPEMQKKFEALQKKEARVAKKEKDLNTKIADYDRRTKLLEDIEEKSGTMASREAALEQKDKDVQTTLRDIKRREKAVKEHEQQLNERDTGLYQREQYHSGLEKELQAKIAAADARDKRLDELQKRMEETERDVIAKKRVSDATTEKANSLLAKAEEQSKAADERLAAAMQTQEEARVRLVTVRAKEEASAKQQTELSQRGVALSHLEKDLQGERDRQQRILKEIKDLEARNASESKSVAQKANDIQRRLAACEEAEEALKRRVETNSIISAETVKKKDTVDRLIAENRRNDVELQQLREELRKQESSVKERERKLRIGIRELEQRETNVLASEERMRGEVALLQEEMDKAREFEKDVRRREVIMNMKEGATAKLKKQCDDKEASMLKREGQLNQKEKELVDWMKEMEWREMMLGDRENVVDREPIKSSSKEVGFSHKAFGKAMIDVQLRRLTDQYISAQLKHARGEISGDDKSRKHSRLPRAGIAPISGASGVLRETSEIAGLGALRDEVHTLALQFVRGVSRLRAFDGFEDPTSPEKLQQLAAFTEPERMTVCMAANLEYILKDQECFLVNLESCPLNKKDKVANVQDLVNQMTKWWRSTRKRSHQRLHDLLRDRQHKLKESIAIIEARMPDCNALVGPRELTFDFLTGAGDTDQHYAEKNVYEHVKESKVLAPRILTSLKAISASEEMSKEHQKRKLEAESRVSVKKAGDPMTPRASPPPNGQFTHPMASPPGSPAVPRPSTSPHGTAAGTSPLIPWCSVPDDVEYCLVRTGRTAALRPPKSGSSAHDAFSLDDVKVKKRALANPYSGSPLAAGHTHPASRPASQQSHKTTGSRKEVAMPEVDRPKSRQ